MSKCKKIYLFELCILIRYRIAGLFRGLKFSLELIFVVYKIFVNIYLMLVELILMDLSLHKN